MQRHLHCAALLRPTSSAPRADRYGVLLVYRRTALPAPVPTCSTGSASSPPLGVAFASATEPLDDTSSFVGRMLVQFLGLFARSKREAIIDRVTQWNEHQAAKGKWAAADSISTTSFAHDAPRPAQRLAR